MELVGTQIGEAFVGEGDEAAHLNTVLGARGGPVETAWATALATPRAGFVPFVTVLQPGLAVKPLTLFVAKAEVRGERHERLTWGAAQAGVAAGVVDALAQRTIDPALVDDLLLIAAVWVAPTAADERLTFENNREATAAALRAGRDRLPAIGDLLARRDAAWNPFFPPA